jgi:tetraacyldisaccharide 4'-kinase
VASLPVSEPAWWYRSPPSWGARALGPIARVWGTAAERRYRRGEGYRCPLPVVCIGNFTAGGTGKTPLALLIAGRLAALGARPAFLTRGYGGGTTGPHWVALDRDRASDVGDEPLLLARTAPTLVCRNRAAGARAIIATGARHGAIVMDDGLQNGALEKNLTIAVVDGRRGVGNGLVIPAGPLRAPLEFQLSLADAIVVNVPESSGETGPASDFPDWLKHHFGGPVMRARTRPDGDMGWIDGQPLVAFSGIGAPERFFQLIEKLGGRIVERRVFADHHAFTDPEARGLLASARRHGARLCTTEKDWVRLASEGDMGALRAEALTLPIRLELDERDALRLDGLLEASLAVGRGRGA